MAISEKQEQWDDDKIKEIDKKLAIVAASFAQALEQILENALPEIEGNAFFIGSNRQRVYRRR